MIQVFDGPFSAQMRGTNVSNGHDWPTAKVNYYVRTGQSHVLPSWVPVLASPKLAFQHLLEVPGVGDTNCPFLALLSREDLP